MVSKCKCGANVAGCVFGVELMRVLVWVTPAGTMDEGGVEQPAYLNFDTTLLSAPLGNEMSVRAPCLPIPHPPCAREALCAEPMHATVPQWPLRSICNASRSSCVLAVQPCCLKYQTLVSGMRGSYGGIPAAALAHCC